MLFAHEAMPKLIADVRITLHMQSPICCLSTTQFWDEDKNYFRPIISSIGSPGLWVITRRLCISVDASMRKSPMGERPIQAEPVFSQTGCVVTRVKAKAEARAAARANKVCLHCGEPIEAQRSTRQYCSEAHRVAAFRERQGSTPV